MNDLPMTGYGRVSAVSGRAEHDSYGTVEIQDRAMRGWAALHGVTLSEVVIETDVSGGTAAADRDLGRLIQQVVDGHSGGIVCPTLDRFGRNLIELLLNADTIKQAGGRLVCIGDSIDTSTDTGTLQLGIMGTLAQIQRERFAKRWEDSIERAIAQGVWVLSTVPVGYSRVPVERDERGRRITGGQLLVDPVNAAHVAWAFEARIGGTSWGQIAQELNRRGIRISKSGVASLMGTRAYLGEVYSGAHVKENAHPALVDRRTWESAQARDVRPRHTGRSSEHGLLAYGIAVCSGCGAPMGIAKASNGVYGYKCRAARMNGCPSPAYLTIAHVDDALIPELEARMNRDRDVAAEEAELARVNALAARAEADLDAFLEHASPADLGSRYAHEVNRYRLRIHEAQAEVEALQATMADALFAGLGSALVDAPIDAQRRLARILIDNVTIYPRTSNPRWAVTWRR